MVKYHNSGGKYSVGDFKNPKHKAWTELNPKKEVKQMWKILKNESELKATLNSSGMWGIEMKNQSMFYSPY